MLHEIIEIAVPSPEVFEPFDRLLQCKDISVVIAPRHIVALPPPGKPAVEHFRVPEVVGHEHPHQEDLGPHLHTKGFIDTPVLLGTGTDEAKVQEPSLRQCLRQYCRPRLVVLYPIAKNEGIPHHHNVSLFGPWPGVAKTVPIRVVNSLKISPRNKPRVIWGMQIANVRVANTPLVWVILELLFDFFWEQIWKQSQAPLCQHYSYHKAEDEQGNTTHVCECSHLYFHCAVFCRAS
jgi:hypothetical protein